VGVYLCSVCSICAIGDDNGYLGGCMYVMDYVDSEQRPVALATLGPDLRLDPNRPDILLNWLVLNQTFEISLIGSIGSVRLGLSFQSDLNLPRLIKLCIRVVRLI